MSSTTSRLLLAATAALVLSGCGPQATPDYFIAPTMGPALAPAQSRAVSSPTGVLEPTASPTVQAPSPTPPCTDGLTYLQDLTIPDGTVVVPGQLIEKRWQVKNSGTCNWDQRYHLELVGGEPMGVESPVPLFPARAGSEATIQIVFVAPDAPGTYESQWQAVSPDDVPFGNAFYMQIIVSG